MQSIRPLTANCKLANNAAGLPVLTINNDYAKAEISLFGAHVLSYQRHGEPASIWLSDKAVLDGSKPVRGGIPICWPWFGPAPARVGSGKLFVLVVDPVKDIEKRPAMQQLLTSVRNYVASDRFAPTVTLQLYELDALFDYKKSRRRKLVRTKLSSSY